MFRLAFNPTDSPVLIDDDGHTLPGGEWGPALTTESAVKAALEAGQLVWSQDPSDDADPAAVAASKRVADLNAPKKSKSADAQTRSE